MSSDDQRPERKHCSSRRFHAEEPDNQKKSKQANTPIEDSAACPHSQPHDARRTVLRSNLSDTGDLLENAQIPIIESDKRMTITHCNAATTAVFGYSRDELIGQRVNILMQPRDSQRHDGYIDAYERTGVKKILATTGRTVDGRHKNGSALTLQLTTSSTPKGYAAVFVDMTAHVDTERALAAQHARADAERSMKDFLVGLFFGV
jgi:PAS domain S-box-containing protein